MKTQHLILLLGLFVISCSQPFKLTIDSPDNQLACSVGINEKLLCLQMTNEGDTLFDKSPLLIYLDDRLIAWNIVNVSSKQVKDSFDMPVGEYKSIRSSVLQKRLQLKGKTEEGASLDAQLEIRMFNHALAYRFILDLPDKQCDIEEKSQLIQRDKEISYFIPNGEFEPIGHVTMDELSSKRSYNTPLIWKKQQTYISFHEANLHNYAPLTINFSQEKNALVLNPGKVKLSGMHTALPWRVLFVGHNFADLHNCKWIFYTLSDSPQGDFSWVKPGISMWDWRVRGCTFKDFTYEMNTVSLKHFVDFSSDNGLSYFLLDADWYEPHNPLKPLKSIDIQELIRYANAKKVGIWLYYDLAYMGKHGKEIDFETVAKTFSSWGAKGIKYGFLGAKGSKYGSQDKERITEKIIQIAARYQLMVDFHDGPIPYSGLERTYPNYLSREYCHAQLDRRTAFTPIQFIRMACVNLLAGPMDQTNGTYDLNQMKSRSKGPKNEYNSTVSSENARFFITHTGNFAVLLDAPEAYSEKADLFEFIKQLPLKWDETKYLDLNFDSHVMVARRKDQTWYVGCVYDKNGGNSKLSLSFLEKDASYDLTLFQDTKLTNFMTNKESYQIVKIKVKKGDVIPVFVAPGGGYSAIISKF
ncbi:MAG: glycoside hydrolase family 97 catalytic domain-containing protein [Bacteroidaceae bacterium]